MELINQSIKKEQIKNPTLFKYYFDYTSGGISAILKSWNPMNHENLEELVPIICTLIDNPKLLEEIFYDIDK